MDRITDQEYLVGDQYKDSSNLSARIRLHELFSTNTYGWLPWVFDHLLDLPEDARILELGCGPGGLWASNLDRIPSGWNVTLSDLSPGMLEQARHSLGDTSRDFDFEVIDAQSIPYTEGTFDGVVANHMLYHLPDRAKGIGEIHRVLKPGRRLFAATNGRGSMRALWDILNTVARSSTDEFNRPARLFSLESGEVELLEIFTSVTVDRREDALHVTQVEPVIDYIQSTQRELTAGQLAELRQRLADQIERNGKFVVDKANGILIARK